MERTLWTFSASSAFLSQFFELAILGRKLCTAYLHSLNSRREASTIELASYVVISFSTGGQPCFWRVMFIIVKAQWKQLDAQRHKSLLTISCMKPDVGGGVLLHPVQCITDWRQQKIIIITFGVWILRTCRCVNSPIFTELKAWQFLYKACVAHMVTFKTLWRWYNYSPSGHRPACCFFLFFSFFF
jgi:hypothetical protein